MMRSTARTYLRVLLALSLVQQVLFRRLLLQGPGGKLMSCLIKPCMREEPLWAGLGVFLGCGMVCVSKLRQLAKTAPFAHADQPVEGMPPHTETAPPQT